MDKLERMNQWLTLVTSLGVIAGLLVLIIEISQNTIAMQNQVDVEIWAQGTGGYLLENPELVELSVRAVSEPWDSFSPNEQFRMRILWSMTVDRAELQFRLRQRTGELLTSDNIVFPEQLLSQDSFKTWWEQTQRYNYPPEFVDFFNSYSSERGN